MSGEFEGNRTTDSAGSAGHNGGPSGKVLFCNSQDLCTSILVYLISLKSHEYIRALPNPVATESRLAFCRIFAARFTLRRKAASQRIFEAATRIFCSKALHICRSRTFTVKIQSHIPNFSI